MIGAFFKGIMAGVIGLAAVSWVVTTINEKEEAIEEASSEEED